MTTLPDRASEARTVPLLDVFAALGIAPMSRGTYGPCPACGAATRGSEDRRGPLGLTSSRAGWRCHRCHAGGDGLSAVRARVGDWPAVWGWYADRGWCTPPAAHVSRPVPPPPPAPPPKPPPPPVDPEEVRALLRQCGPVPEIPDARMRPTRRGLVWWLPEGARLPRWAFGGGRTWLESGHRVLVPLYDARGRLAGVRARVADRAAGHPKARPPSGHSIGRVCMACPTARAWLRGGPAPEGVVVVEGEPGWVLWADAVPADVAVLGIVSGSWGPEWRERCAGLPVVVVTDHDGSGDRYWALVSEGLRAVRWPHEKDEPPREGVRW